MAKYQQGNLNRRVQEHLPSNLFKPKRSKPHRPPGLTNELKLQKAAEMCARLKIKDVIVPASMILLERFEAGKSPVGGLEEYVFPHLSKWKATGKIKDLKPAQQAYKSISKELKQSIFHPALVDWDLQKPLDNPSLLGEAWAAEGVAQAKVVLYDEPVPTDGPGAVRPWMGEIYDPDVNQRYLAPWPWINSINNIRTGNHLPPVDTYELNEYETVMSGTFNEDTNQVDVSFDVKCNACSIPANKAPDGKCLRVPEVRPGGSIEIVGFNFFSNNCRIRLRNTKTGKLLPDLPAIVHGDLFTPLKDGDQPIVDARVRDRLTVDLPANPDSNLYGDYSVTVVVPNDVNYALNTTAGSNPCYDAEKNEFLSNAGYIRVLPSGDQKYKIYLEKGICYDQTDGEWFSDEIYVAGYPVMFTADQGSDPVKMPTSKASIWGDVDPGETKEHWDWNPFGDFNQTFNMKDSILALGLVGYEVDSEDALWNQIKNYGDAYWQYLKEVWAGVLAAIGVSAGGITMAAILKGIAAELGVAWSLLVGGIILAMILAIGLIYAAWAAPDMIFKDVIVLSETDLFNRTNSEMPVNRHFQWVIRLDDDFTARIIPEYTGNFFYTEERRYTSNEQGSTYGFVFKYQRVQ